MRRALHWVVVAALLAVAAAVVVGVVHQRPRGGAEVFGAVCSAGLAGIVMLVQIDL